MNNFIGYMKSVNNNEIIEGYATTILERQYLMRTASSFNSREYSTILTEVSPAKCVKEIAELPNGNMLFEYDVFKLLDGTLFYIIFDITRLAVVYISQPAISLPDNISLFNCECVGNLKLNEELISFFTYE